MAETAVDADKAPEDPSHGPTKEKFWALALGSVGVVFGDIGTSPLYAMREALSHSKGGGGGELAVLGVVSLITWALILIVTIKYVTFLMRADNKGEGGTLALMALAQRVSPGGRSTMIFVLGMVGAARGTRSRLGGRRRRGRGQPRSSGRSGGRFWRGTSRHRNGRSPRACALLLP